MGAMKRRVRRLRGWVWSGGWWFGGAACVFAEGDAVDDERPIPEVDELAAMPDAVGSPQTEGVLEAAVD